MLNGIGLLPLQDVTADECHKSRHDMPGRDRLEQSRTFLDRCVSCSGPLMIEFMLAVGLYAGIILCVRPPRYAQHCTVHTAQCFA